MILLLFCFLIGNLAFTSMASSAVAADMIVYLMREYHMDMASGSNLIYFWSAVTNFAPVIGAFMADSSVGRFQMIGFGSVLGFLVIFSSQTLRLLEVYI